MYWTQVVKLAVGLTRIGKQVTGSLVAKKRMGEAEEEYEAGGGKVRLKVKERRQYIVTKDEANELVEGASKRRRKKILENAEQRRMDAEGTQA